MIPLQLPNYILIYIYIFICVYVNFELMYRVSHIPGKISFYEVFDSIGQGIWDRPYFFCESMYVCCLDVSLFKAEYAHLRMKYTVKKLISAFNDYFTY